MSWHSAWRSHTCFNHRSTQRYPRVQNLLQRCWEGIKVLCPWRNFVRPLNGFSSLESQCKPLTSYSFMQLKKVRLLVFGRVPSSNSFGNFPHPYALYALALIASKGASSAEAPSNQNQGLQGEIYPLTFLSRPSFLWPRLRTERVHVRSAYCVGEVFYGKLLQNPIDNLSSLQGCFHVIGDQ